MQLCAYFESVGKLKLLKYTHENGCDWAKIHMKMMHLMDI